MDPTKSPAKNVLGTELKTCSTEPLTGFFRDGCCNTSSEDHGVHTVCAEMTEEFFNEITPYIKGPDVGEEVKKLMFCGHSLGGSIAMILAAWTKLRLDVDCVKMKVNVHTYGSPNVLALDMSLLNKMEKEEKDAIDACSPNAFFFHCCPSWN